jgi:hypothetical protein
VDDGSTKHDLPGKEAIMRHEVVKKFGCRTELMQWVEKVESDSSP